ncbi:MAG: CPBP family intramembrane glutamic endopeptidase [Phycisphaerales bacterium JB039]
MPDHPQPASPPETYAQASRSPLHILVLLAPLVVAYEIGSALYLSGADGAPAETIRATRMLSRFFEAFGAAGLYLPGVALVTVLLIWHLLERRPWRIRPAVIGLMAVETLGWTVALLVLQALISAAVGPAPLLALAAAQDLAAQPWQARLTLSIGAGIYEELLFRMILIAGLHFAIVDVARLGETAGRIGAVGISAVAFALYHDLSGSDLSAQFFAYFAAGVFFGALYLGRGFGLVVATHALYDVAVLLILTPGPSP